MKEKLKVKAKLFVLYIAIENKKIYRERDRPIVFITHHAIFDVENSITLTMVGYSMAFWICAIICQKIIKNKVWKNQPERRKAQVRDERWQVKPIQASNKVENVSARYYQQRRPIFSFDWKSKDFQFPENKEVNISLEENVFSRSASVQRCDHEEADTRIAVYVLHALNKRHNQFLTQKQWTQTL